MSILLFINARADTWFANGKVENATMGKMIKEDISYAEQFSQFLGFIRQCQEDFSIAESLREGTEAETQDILHKLELEDISYHEYARLSKVLKKVRIERRKAKDTIEQLGPLVTWVAQNNKVIKELEKVLGEMRKAEKNMCYRHYNPKTNIVNETLKKERKD